VLEVRVAARPTGDPIPSAEVAIPVAGAIGLTDARGTVRFRGIPPGSYRLHVSALGFEARVQDVVAVNGQVTSVSVRLGPAPLDLPGVEVASAHPGAWAEAVQIRTADLPPGVRDLPGALEEVPGVTVVRRGGAGSQVGVQLRGAAPDQVLVLLDGVPLNSPLHGDVDLSTVDLGSLERIVVLPGARTARYGPRALGGVVLLETGSRSESWADLSLGVGAWGERRGAANLDWRPSPRWSLFMGGRRTQGDGDFLYPVPEFRGGGEARRENARFRMESVRLGLSGTAKRGEVDLRLHLSRTRRGTPGTIAQPSLTARQRHHRGGISLRAESRREEGGVAVLLGVQEQDTRYQDPSPPFGQAYDQSARVTQKDLSVEAWRAFGPVDLTAGGDVRRMGIDSNADGLTPSTVKEGGIWGQGSMVRPMGQGLRLGLQAGIRLDHHDLISDPTLSPSLGIRLLRGGTRLEVAYRNGFSPPGLSDLFFQEGVLAKPNPDLRPERVQGELSLTVAHTTGPGPISAEGQVSLYQADIDDMIFWFPDFRFIWRPENLNVARRGMEVLASMGAPVLGSPLSLSGSIEWSRVTYRDGVLAGQVVYRPRVTASARIRWNLEWVETTLSAHHTGSRHTVAGSAVNALDPYTLLDWGMAFPLPVLPVTEVGGRVDLSFTNILDEKSSLLADYPLPGRGWSVGLTLQPSRSP